MKNALHIWRGSTAHTRLKPFEHRFRYPVAMVGIDLCNLPAADQMSGFFSVNRAGIFSFHEKDFGARDGSSLLDWSLQQFDGANIPDVKRVVFICQPRILGFQFNPVSLHFGYGRDDDLLGIIYEVHNTFGDSHAYVAPVKGRAVEQHIAKKTLHVSPFFDVSGQYEFALQPPDNNLSLAIRKVGDQGPDFRASMSLKRKDATTRAFLAWFIGFPFSTLTTIALIHFEALRLWFKGARYHHRPSPPARPSTRVLETKPQKE